MYEQENTPKVPVVPIKVDYRPDKHGRMSKVFHLFDENENEVIYCQKDAIRQARSILKIAKEK